MFQGLFPLLMVFNNIIVRISLASLPETMPPRMPLIKRMLTTAQYKGRTDRPQIAPKRSSRLPQVCLSQDCLSNTSPPGMMRFPNISSLFGPRAQEPEAPPPVVSILGWSEHSDESLSVLGDGTFAVAAFCDYGGVFAFRDMPFDPLFDSNVTPYINMASIELVCAPSDRPRHVRNLRTLCTRYLGIKDEDLPMPGVFYDALENMKDTERIYFACIRMGGSEETVPTCIAVGGHLQSMTTVVMPLQPIEGSDGWGKLDVDHAVYQARVVSLRGRRRSSAESSPMAENAARDAGTD